MVARWDPCDCYACTDREGWGGPEHLPEKETMDDRNIEELREANRELTKDVANLAAAVWRLSRTLAVQAFHSPDLAGLSLPLHVRSQLSNVAMVQSTIQRRIY
jgi:hypothetical protein